MNDERNAVAVFGGGDLGPADEPYERARTLGAALAQRGVPVVTGGYAGVMEAASRGAREAGGEAIGITCRSFRGRTPNPWISLEIEEPDLMTRTDRLFRLARGIVVLAGRAGTIGELGMAWALLRGGALACPVVLWDDTWSRLYEELKEAGRLDAPVNRWTRSVSNLDEALDALSSGPGIGDGA